MTLFLLYYDFFLVKLWLYSRNIMTFFLKSHVFSLTVTLILVVHLHFGPHCITLTVYTIYLDYKLYNVLRLQTDFVFLPKMALLIVKVADPWPIGTKLLIIK